MAFPTTRWSVVLGASRGKEGGGSPKALHELCAVYWKPLYAYLRRDGLTPEDAEDMVQGFLSSLLSRPAIDGVEAERGRFRAYLLGALRNYLLNARVRDRAQKRGGEATHVPLSVAGQGAGIDLQIPDGRTPEAAYAYVWAMAILQQTEDKLAAQHEARGKAEAFAALRPFLTSGDAPAYRDVAERLGTTEAAARVAVHRLRTEFRTVLRQHVADTVANPSTADIDDELRAVIGAIAEHQDPVG